MDSAERGLAVLDAHTINALVQRNLGHVGFDQVALQQTSDYLVKKLIDRRSLVVVFGQSGVGKTFWIIDLVAHIACGFPWRGRRIKQAMVVYIASEAGRSILPRFVAWGENRIGEAREERVPLAIIPRAVNLLDEEDIKKLLTEMKDIGEEYNSPIALVVFDTLARSMAGGDENTSKDMGKVIAVADRIREEVGAGTIFVHHSGKDASKGARGSSALFAAADTVIEVSDKGAKVEKSRDGVIGESFAFNLRSVELGYDEDGEPITTCIVDHASGTGAKRHAAVKLNDSEKIAFDALEKEIESSGTQLPPTSAIPSATGVKIDTWKATFYRLYGEERSDEATKRAFTRAKAKLIAAKLVGVSAPWAWKW